MELVSRELWQQVTGTQPDEAAKGLVVRFEMFAEQDETASSEQGRPVFSEHEYIEIRSPNDPFSLVHRRATAKDRNQFPQTYKAWKEGVADPVTGTPLSQWTPIAKSQAEQLGIRGVRTVEQFAEVSDDGCAQLGHGWLTLRNKAQAWLAAAKDASGTTKLAAELSAANNEIRNLQRQVQELATIRAEKDEAEAKPKRARG